MKIQHATTYILAVVLVALALLLIAPHVKAQDGQPPTAEPTIMPTVTLPSDDPAYNSAEPVEPPAQPAEPVSVDFAGLLVGFGSLTGLSALIAAATNIGKTIGWVKDGSAPAVITGLSLIGLIALFVLNVFRPDIDVQGLDATAGSLATVLLTVFGFVWSMRFAKTAHNTLKGLPVVGKSFSATATVPARAEKPLRYEDFQE